MRLLVKKKRQVKKDMSVPGPYLVGMNIMNTRWCRHQRKTSQLKTARLAVNWVREEGMPSHNRNVQVTKDKNVTETENGIGKAQENHNGEMQ